MRQLIYFGLQPLLMTFAIGSFVAAPDSAWLFLVVLLIVQVVLGTAEHILPARPEWRIGAAEKTRNALLVYVLLIASILVAEFYDARLREPLEVLRVSLDLDFWPHHWPLVAQILLVFFASEFIWYWLHRAEHRWSILWRISGHGAHHAFKRLGALNFGLNHPLEYFLIVLPSALIELTFGVGIAAAGAAFLGVTQASIAHANLELNTRGIGLLFTTNRYHIRHHSAVLEESNTNYGCAAIVWDRLFGTFADSRIVEAGTGPTEPSLWEKFLMPIREPKDTQIAPNSASPAARQT